MTDSVVIERRLQDSEGERNKNRSTQCAVAVACWRVGHAVGPWLDPQGTRKEGRQKGSQGRRGVERALKGAPKGC